MRQVHPRIAQLPDHGDAVFARHVDVQKSEVRFDFLDQLDRFQTITRSGHQLDLGEVSQQERQLIASQLFIVNDDSRQRCRRALSHRVGIIAFRPAPACLPLRGEAPPHWPPPPSPGPPGGCLT